MEYEINPRKINKLTALPSEIREYINEVSGESLKVLFLIFSEDKNSTSSEIATKLDLTISQVEDSLRFWKSKEIILAPKKENAVFSIDKPCASQISTNELKEAMTQNQYVKMLFNQSEQLYARPLKPIERRTLLYIYEFYNLSIDVILMVVDFCIRYNKPPRQLLSICEEMSDDNVNTHEQAEKRIQILTEKYNIESQVRHCFGIYDRKLSLNEKKMIHKWFIEYGFGINMMRLAFNRCVDSIGKLSFQYIDKILSNWRKENVKTPQDLETLEAAKPRDRKPKPKNQPPRKTSYDLNQLLSKSGLFIPN